MARYIDVDSMKNDIIKLRRTLDINKCSNDFACGWVIGVDNMEGIIDRQPTADVVEVVRCKNCKHRRETTQGSYCLPVYGLKRITDLNAYCSYGEKK